MVEAHVCLLVLGCLWAAISAQDAGGKADRTTEPKTRVSGVEECRPGVVCDFEKCALRSGGETCCRCSEWLADGSCTSDGWTRVNGTGNCAFDVMEPPPGACPTGVDCEQFKCAVRGDPTTCCDCEEWNADGSCTAVGWIPRVEGAMCDFEVSQQTGVPAMESPSPDEEAESISTTTAVPPPTTDSEPPPEEDPEDISPFRAVAQPVEDSEPPPEEDTEPISSPALEQSAAGSDPPPEEDPADITPFRAVAQPVKDSERSPEEDRERVSPSPSTPQNDIEPASEPGTDLEDRSPSPAPSKSDSGSEPPLEDLEDISPFSAGVQSTKDATPPVEEAAEPFTPPEMSQPCPTDGQCDTIQCAILEGAQICCECLLRRTNGQCAKGGWFLLDSIEESCPLTTSVP